jgi:hypothetical protein
MDYELYGQDLGALSSYLTEFGYGGGSSLSGWGLGAATPKSPPRSIAKAAARKPPPKAPPRVVSKATAKPTATAVANAAPRSSAQPSAEVAVQKPGTMRVSVKETQATLRKHGAKVGADGKYGAVTARVWADAARRLKLDPTYDRAGPDAAFVNMTTYSALTYNNKETVAKAAPPVKAATSKAGAVKVAVGTAKPSAPATRVAVGPVKVATAAKSTVTRGAGSTKPTEASNAAYIKVTVESAQTIIRKLGAKITVDKMYGPTTAKLWAEAARRMGLDSGADRASASEIWVHPATYSALSAKAAESKSPVKGKAPASTGGGAKATEATQAGMVQASVGIVQDILRKLGAKITRDGSYGPATRTAWVTRARAKRLPEAFDRAGPTAAWVVPATYDALAAAAGFPGLSPNAPQPPSAQDSLVPAPASDGEAPTSETSTEQALASAILAASTASVSIADVQKALIVARRAAPQKFAGVEVTGQWDEATQAAYASLAQYAPGVKLSAFQMAAPQLLAQPGQFRTTPALAKAIEGAARIYDEGQAGAERQQEVKDQTQTHTGPQTEAPVGPGPVMTPTEQRSTTPDPVDMNPGVPPFYQQQPQSNPPTIYVPPQQPVVTAPSEQLEPIQASTSDSNTNMMLVLALVAAGMLAIYVATQSRDSGGGGSRSRSRSRSSRSGGYTWP